MVIDRLEITPGKNATLNGSEHCRARGALIKFYTADQVAEAFGVSPRSVRRWIEQEKLVAHYFGAAVRIAESDLKAFIARHRDP